MGPLALPGRRLLRSLVALSIVSLSATAAEAATAIWGGGDGTFSNSANWVGGSAPGSSDTAAFSGWAPLARSGWTVSASVNSGNAGNATDGNRSTFWDTGSTNQTPGQYYTIDMGSTQTFQQVTIDSTTRTSDYPRGFTIYGSTNGSSWIFLTTGAGSSALVTATLTSPVSYRWIKIQLTSSAANWWSIGELFVYGTAAETELSRNGWTASASASGGSDPPSNAIDGNYGTKWSADVVQSNGIWFSVDMGSAQTFTRIDMDAYVNTTDYPRSYDVYVSSDGTNWGSRIATQTPSTPYTSITFSAQTKRYIKIIQTGSSSSYWWSLFEFKVYGTPANCTIGSNASVGAVTLSNSVTVTQSNGVTLSTSGAFTQSAGTFSGGNSKIDVGGTFSLSGGAFTSTSGILEVDGAFSVSGGTFSHHNGTVMLASTSNQTFASNGAAFYNLVINDGLVGYWKLDEGSGTTAADSSGNGNTGTVSASGATWQSGGPSALDFDNSNSLSLNGSTGYVSLGLNNMPANNAAQTISVWAKLNSTGGNQNLVALTNVSNSGIQLKINGTNLGAYQYGGGTLVTTAAPSTGTWHHIAYTYDGASGQALYIDGIATTASVANQTGTPTAAYLGTYNPSNEMYNGSLDEVRIYSRALSATEVSSLYLGGQPNTTVATETMTGSPSVSNDFTIASGTLDIGTNTLSVGGNWWNYGGLFVATYWNGAAIAFTGSALTNKIRSSAQVLPNISFTGSGKWTLTDNLDVDPNDTITMTTGSLDLSTRTLRAGNIASGSGTLTTTNATVILNGNSNRTLGVGAYNNLRIEDPSENYLAGYWKLDEGQGPMTREWTGTGHTGLLTGAVKWSNATPGSSKVEYFDPNDVLLDGSTAYIDAGAAATATNAAFTACAWVNFSALTGDHTLLSMDGSNISSFWLKRDSTTAKFQMVMSGSDSTSASFYYATGTTTPVTGTWYHVCGVYTGSVTRVFVNGTQEGSDVTVSSSFSASGHTIIGAGYWSGVRTNSFLKGYIDDVRIYSVALSAAQIKQLGNGRYANTAGVATYTLGTALSTSGSFDVDSGIFDPAGYIATASGGLTVRNGGTLLLDTASGTVKLGSGQTLVIDGTLNASISSAAIQSVSGTYTFKIGSTLTAAPTVSVSALAVKNTDASGMYINANNSASTTITQLDNVAFSSGAGSGGYYLQIYSTSLSLFSNGCTFDVSNSTKAVKLTGNGTSDGDTRAIFGGAYCSASPTLCGPSNKTDDDASPAPNGDGVGDTGGNGAVVQFVRAQPTDIVGAIQGFPTTAFDWTTYTPYATYVAYNGPSSNDNVYVRKSDGSANYSWPLPANVGDIIGTPRWIQIGGNHYLYVATTSGRVYRLKDSGTSLALDSTPWDTPYFNGGSATITSPLALDGSNVYWMGTDSSGNRKFFILSHSKTLVSGSTSLPVGVSTDPTATPALGTVSNVSYLFAGMKGYVSRLKISDQSLTSWAQPVAAQINGRLALNWTATLVYAVDNRGNVFAVNTSSMATDWSYQDTASHSGTCADGGPCTIQGSFLDVANGYLMYGDQDGHFYVTSKNGSSGTVLSGYPVQPAANEAITGSPFYYNGILLFGTSSGSLFIYNRRTAATGTPSLLRTYKLGSAVSTISYNSTTNSNAGAYMVGTASGKLIFIDPVSDGDSYQ